MTVNEKYEIFEHLLTEWNQKINLVAPSTLPQIRTRHIDDSAQLANYIPKDKTVVDIGSGAGFPAAVLAILDYKVIAIESIAKKCRFLEILKKDLDLPNLTIINDRAESIIRQIDIKNSVWTARAVAPIVKILDWTKSAKMPYFLLKGHSAQQEINEAKEKHKLDFELFPSTTGDGFVVHLFHVK